MNDRYKVYASQKDVEEKQMEVFSNFYLSVVHGITYDSQSGWYWVPDVSVNTSDELQVDEHRIDYTGHGEIEVNDGDTLIVYRVPEGKFCIHNMTNGTWADIQYKWGNQLWDDDRFYFIHEVAHMFKHKRHVKITMYLLYNEKEVQSLANSCLWKNL